MKQIPDYYRDEQTRVDVYFNLHKKLFSVRECKTGRVIGHSDVVVLKAVEFKVSESGRQRVLAERRKNVHAYARGILVNFDCSLILEGRVNKVSYNPYKAGYFYLADSPRSIDHCPVHTALHAYMAVDENRRAKMYADAPNYRTPTNNIK